jgi:hypothetical protein
MRRSRAPSTAPGTFFVAQSWADCITNMAGFKFTTGTGANKYVFVEFNAWLYQG